MGYLLRAEDAEDIWDPQPRQAEAITSPGLEFFFGDTPCPIWIEIDKKL